MPEETVKPPVEMTAPPKDTDSVCVVLPIFIAPKVLPAGVIDTAPDAAKKFMVPLCVHVMPATAVKEP